MARHAVEKCPGPKTATRKPAGNTPRAYAQEGFCHLHVVIPVEARQRIRLMAVKSRMTLKSYLARLLMSAEPIGEIAVQAPKEHKLQSAGGTAEQEKQDE